MQDARIAMDHVTGYLCMCCGAAYALEDVDYLCPRHGNEGILDVRYDYDLLRARLTPAELAESREMSMWRYKPLLPVRADAVVPPLRVGWTPLYAAPRLGSLLGLSHVWVKDDGLNPTASFKDRASALAIVKAQERGARIVTTASTGNAAAALAGLAASVGLTAVIFVPKSAPLAKVAQHLVYGAHVILVDGTYDEAFELTVEVAREFGWYNRNTAYNPFMSEGKKTGAYEIWEQLDGQVPDCVFVPVGDGCMIGGIYKGFKDLLALGWIDRLPRLIGVQAEGSSALVNAFACDLPLDQIERVEGAHTVADSICAGLPRDHIKALTAVRETGGAFLSVSDTEILSAIPVVARNTGVFCEPAAAASYAGLVAAVEQGLVARDERVVLLLTGSGLKDIASAMQTVSTPPVVKPQAKRTDTLAAVRSALGDLF
jgi:threonine synthase